MAETPLNEFLIACGRAPENPMPPQWARVLRRWATKHSPHTPEERAKAADRAEAYWNGYRRA